MECIKKKKKLYSQLSHRLCFRTRTLLLATQTLFFPSKPSRSAQTLPLFVVAVYVVSVVAEPFWAQDLRPEAHRVVRGVDSAGPEILCHVTRQIDKHYYVTVDDNRALATDLL